MNYNAYKVRKNLLIVGILVLLIISLLFGFCAYIGTYSGTFIIGVDKHNEGSISLSTTRDFIQPTAYLQATPRENA